MNSIAHQFRSLTGQLPGRSPRRLLWIAAPLALAAFALFVLAPLVLPFDWRYWFGAEDSPAEIAVGDGPRDPFRQPFAADSPWNLPLGSDAEYARIESPDFSIYGGGNLNVADWTHPIYRASEGDPLVTIQEFRRREKLAIRIPAEAQPDPQADGHLHIVDPSGRWVYEMYQAVRRGDDLIQTNRLVKNDLYGPGVYDDWHGVRAYGGSAIGGLIRQGELTTGIHHPLAVAVRRYAMNKNGAHGKPYVWPASAADVGWETTYGSYGNLYMGSLLAIPPEVDLDALGLRSRAGMEIAQALQTYGAYITDAADTNLVFYAEPACATEVPPGIRYDLRRIVEHLQVVTNNSPQSPGGGGVPLAPLAAKLQEVDAE